jgi:hypothetical protein
MRLEKEMDKQLIQIADKIIENKIQENSECLRITFYELRIKYDQSEEQTDRILELMKNKLENMNYQVYFTGVRFEYQECKRTVQPNELLIAIKE